MNRCVVADVEGLVARRGYLPGNVSPQRLSKALSLKTFATAAGNPRISRDNPLLNSEQTAHLDENGLVRVGTVVAKGMVAASIVKPAIVGAEEALLAAIFGGDQKEQSVVDASECFERQFVGYEVVSVERKNIRDRIDGQLVRLELGQIDQVDVVLEKQHVPEIGDQFRLNGNVLTLAKILDDTTFIEQYGPGVDLVIPIPVQDSSTSTDEVEFCNSASEVIEVRSVGAYSPSLYTPAKTLGESGQRVTRKQIGWLLANGFRNIASEFVGLKCSDLTNRPRILAAASKGLNDKGFHAEPAAPESLFRFTQYLRALGLNVEERTGEGGVALVLSAGSAEVLHESEAGVLESHETINSRTKAPEKGGLLCETLFGPETHEQRDKPARYDLHTTYLPAFFRMGSKPIASRVLGIPIEQIDGLLSGELGLNADRAIVEENDSSECLTGNLAIEQLLTAVHDIGTFRAQNLLAKSLYVLPPAYRPCILLDDGGYLTSDLNGLYSSVVLRNKRLVHAGKSGRADSSQFQVWLQHCLDHLQVGDELKSGDEESTRSILDHLLSMLTDDNGLAVDWSAKARLVVDDGLEPGICLLPSEIFDGLQCRVGQLVLLVVDAEFVACEANPCDGSVILVSRDVSERLNAQSGKLCGVHRPLTEAAGLEAASLQTYTDSKPAESHELSRAQWIDKLVDHVFSGEPLVMDSPELFMIGGGGATKRISDADCPKPKPATASIPKTHQSSPSKSEMREVIDSQVRQTLRFTFNLQDSLESDMKPADGRIGGRPWLPEGFSWPMADDGYVPFLGQLPVRPSSHLHLPFSVEEEMLITIFWDEEWFYPPTAGTRFVFLHDTQEMHLADTPSGVKERRLHSIEPEWLAELPPPLWLSSILKFHFGELDAAERDKVFEEVDADSAVRFVEPASSLAGYAHWIQESSADYVAQIFADDIEGVNFFDAGGLYVVGDSPEDLRAFVQTH